MLRQFSAKRTITLFLIDWLGTLAMLAVAVTLRDALGALPALVAQGLRWLAIPVGGLGPVEGVNSLLSSGVFVLVAGLWPLFFLVVFSVYDGTRYGTFKAELLGVFRAVTGATVTLAGALYFTYRETPRVVFLIFFVLDLALLLGARGALWLYRRATKGVGGQVRDPVLVVGAGAVGRQVVGELAKYGCADFEVLGFVDDDPAKRGKEFESLPVLGTLDEVTQLVVDREIHDAVVALPLRAHERLVSLCQVLQRLSVRVLIVPDMFALSFPSARLTGFGGIPVMDLGEPGVFGWRRSLKRVFDIVLVSIGLILLSPLLLVIALAIKLTSRGPVLYIQRRIGENGRPFPMYKFRSMRVGSDADVHRQHVARLIRENVTLEEAQADGQDSLKLTGDPRVTFVGGILRRLSLDELPQLLNVLRGEMSIVGPRPPLSYEVALYQDWHRQRLQAIPGITGLWQVKGRNRVSFDEMTRMDLEYIEQQSLWLDLKLILQTPLAVLSGRGAG